MCVYYVRFGVENFIVNEYFLSYFDVNYMIVFYVVRIIGFNMIYFILDLDFSKN